MPKISKWINSAIEGLLHSKFRKVTAGSITAVAPKLRKITFTGDFSGLKCPVGYAIAIKVSENEFRNYTPFNFTENGFEIYFYLHDKGPGSKFIKRVFSGQQLKILIPRGKEMYRNDSQQHFYIGDETSIGFCQSLKTQAKLKGEICEGIIEIEDLAIANTLDLNAYWIDKTSPEKINLIERRLINYLKNMDKNQVISFYLTGNSKTLLAARKFLKLVGIPSKNIISQVYWIPGRFGL